MTFVASPNDRAISKDMVYLDNDMSSTVNYNFLPVPEFTVCDFRVGDMVEYYNYDDKNGIPQRHLGFVEVYCCIDCVVLVRDSGTKHILARKNKYLNKFNHKMVLP
jgi:hypothetical protein